MKSKILILYFLIIIPYQTYCQETFNNILENIIEQTPSTSQEYIYEELIDLHQNPVNLNENNLTKLLILPFITTNIINQIKTYKEQNGNILNIYELIYIEQLSRNTIHKISYFIYIKDKKQTLIKIDSTLHYNSKNKLIIQSEKTIKEKKQDKYLGDNWRHLLRYKYSYKKNIYVGLLAEKDKGEEFFKGSQKQGFDYVTGYLQINRKNIIKQINIGDYALNWGQGLIANQCFTNGKSSYTIKYGNNIKSTNKYLSTNENGFLRGLSIVTALTPEIEITSYLSSKKIDTKIDIPNIKKIQEKYIKTIYTTGLHRNSKEIQTKKNSTEKSYGLRAEINKLNYNIAINHLRYSFNLPIQKQTQFHWRRHSFTGKYNTNTSIDYKLNIDKIYIYGEFAISKNKAIAHIIGTTFTTKEDINISLIYRNYAKNYQSQYANAFGEFNNTQNEKGIYIGAEYKINHNIKINAYYDYYKYPYQRYRMKKSDNGNEYLLNIDYKATRKISVYLRYKGERKPLDYKNESLISNKQNILFNCEHIITKKHILKYRVQYNSFSHHNIKEKGILTYIDYRYSSDTFKIQNRICYFKTDNYSTRIYTYENDLLYSFSFPSFFNEGIRIYSNITYKINKISARLKISQTRKKRKNNKTEFKLQINLNF